MRFHRVLPKEATPSITIGDESTDAALDGAE
jgi:hypothetical protein